MRSRKQLILINIFSLLAVIAENSIGESSASAQNQNQVPAAAAPKAKPAAPAKPSNDGGGGNANRPNRNDPALAPDASASTAAGFPGPSASGADDSSGPGLFSGLLDPFDYDPRGRRDPFSQPVADVPVVPGGVHGPLLPLQGFEVNQLRVVGILWNVRSPKAMIKDPSGKLHVVGVNTKIGPRNGYIAVIREGELVVVETIEQDGRLISSAQVVKIAK